MHRASAQAVQHRLRAAADLAEGKVAPAKASSKKADRRFSNKQIFIVPDEVQGAFEAAWLERRGYMERASGFEGFQMLAKGSEYTVVSEWRSIPEFEALNLSKPYRRSHLPSGIFQRVPKPGEGFPEDFVPFVEMNTFVQAKY